MICNYNYSHHITHENVARKRVNEVGIVVDRVDIAYGIFTLFIVSYKLAYLGKCARIF